MTQEVGHYLCHVYREAEKNRIDAKMPVSSERVKEIEDACCSVAEYFSAQNVAKSVIANRNDVIESIVMMASRYGDNPGSAQQVLEHAIFDISRQFANMCSLFRSFLDHYDRYFRKMHGENSLEYTEWAAAKSQQYDDHLAYGLVYQMRNFIQHKDMPPLHLSITDQAGVEGFSIRVDLTVSRLMEDADFRKKFRSRIDINIEKIPMHELIDEWSECFFKIYEVAKHIRLKSVEGAATYLASIRSEIGVDTGRIALVKMNVSGKASSKRLGMGMRWIDEEKCAEIISDVRSHEKSLNPAA